MARRRAKGAAHLANLALEVGAAEKKKDNVADIVTFTEASWGLNMKLYPVQRVILKLHYGMLLDDNPYGFDLSKPVPKDHPKYDEIALPSGQWRGLYKNVVPISTDWRRKEWLYMSEAEYLRHIFDDGRCNIREAPGEELRTMLLSVGRRSGKCVRGDTLIPTDKGLFRIEDMGDVDGPEFQPLRTIIAQEGTKKAETAYFYNGGRKKTVKVTTRCGYEIEGTPNHRIKVLSSNGKVIWRFLGDIQTDDIVCVHRGADLWGSEPTLTEKAGFVLGSTVTDLACLPDSVLKAPKPVVLAFLHGVFGDGDEATLSSDTLAREIQILLVNAGVVSHRDGSLISVPSFTPEVDYFFDPVQSITSGECDVYDLNVPDGHEFVANGMTNHNTQMASVISAYETYKLILKGDPQKYYGIPPGEPIQLISVATNMKQAGILYSKVAGYYKQCAFFTPYTANHTQSYARFQTPQDIERYGRFADDDKANATVWVTFSPCKSSGLRGSGNIVVILDEMAHFVNAGQSSAADVWNAVKPSISAFSPKHPQDTTHAIGPVEGRMIGISSPLGRQGKFYEEFQSGMSGAPNMLCIQAPTWEVNPSIEANEMEQAYRSNAIVFMTEYGGYFTDRTRGWIAKPEDLIACVIPGLRPKLRGRARQPHFVGLDFGLVNDGSAIAIGHLVGDDVELDILDEIRAGEGDYEDYERLEFDDVADWVADYSKKFLFSEGLFDQWAGVHFEQALHKRGLHMLTSDFFSAQKKSQMFRNFEDLMQDKALRLYDWPQPDSETHCAYIEELLELQASFKTKYIINVEAPNMEGKHDDMSDALVRMVWLATQKRGSPVIISNQSRHRASGTMTSFHKARLKVIRRQGGGSHPSRQPKRGRRF